MLSDASMMLVVVQDSFAFQVVVFPNVKKIRSIENPLIQCHPVCKQALIGDVEEIPTAVILQRFVDLEKYAFSTKPVP